ncbi:MAG: N-acetylmuramoyl-L-alanine amidase [Chitinispirillaceae bacterium]
MDNQVVSFNLVMVTLAGVLGLSLVVERVLEFLSYIHDHHLGPVGLVKIPELKEVSASLDNVQKNLESALIREKNENEVEELSSVLEKLESPNSEADSSEIEMLRTKLAELRKKTEWDERVKHRTIVIKDAAPLDGFQIKKAFVCQFFGCALGISLAHLSGIGLFGKLMVHSAKSTTVPLWADILFTGILIGGGSGPVHALIKFLSARKQNKAGGDKVDLKIATAASEAQTLAAPAITRKASLDDKESWVEIPYDGGVDKDKLELAHRRKANPTGIIYHHTAMNRSSSFDDVVSVIKNSKHNGVPWLTGYNCVITREGGIHAFCRWDRYGNHAAGYNMSTLGIALNGNFETDSKDSYSNSTGKYGEPLPTSDQIWAAARVVTLWCYLYNIPVDFSKTVIPHCSIAQKACPGSDFPYESFKKTIEQLYSAWGSSETIQAKIADFRIKPYLFVK